VIEKHVTSDTRFVVAHPEEKVAEILGCVFIQRVAILQGHLSATVVFIELEVHHAGNRVCPVGGRSAIFQDFNALDSRNGKANQIHEAGARVGTPGKWRNATAIDQEERGTRIETAQRNRSRSRWAPLAGRVILNRNTARTHYRLAFEKLFHGALT